MPQRPLLHVFLGPVLEQYFSRETVAFALGSGDSLLSDLSGRFVCWLAFYAAIRVFYRTAAPGISGYAARKYPKAPTSTVSQKLVENMIEVCVSITQFSSKVRQIAICYHPRTLKRRARRAPAIPSSNEK